MKLLTRIQPLRVLGRVSNAGFHQSRYVLQNSLQYRVGSAKTPMNSQSRKKFDELIEGFCSGEPDRRKLLKEIKNTDQDNGIFRFLELVEVLHSGKTLESTNLEKLFGEFELKCSSGRI
jgi:hypothetical protein